MQSYYIAAGYISFRLAPIILVTPIFAYSHIPILIRTVVTIMFSAIIALSLNAEQLALIPKEFSMNVIASEFFLGMLLSLGFHAANGAIHMMSQLIDAQIGFSAGSTFDPVNYQTTSPIGTLFSLVLVATFFFTDAHYDFLFAFAELFRVAPPGVLYSVDAEYFNVISGIFIIGFIIASPVIIGLWLVDAALAMVSRAMPQAQIYFVAMPLKILIGLFILSITLNSAQYTLHGLIQQPMRSWEHIIRI